MIPDLSSRAVVQDPYPTYATLRREAPVLHDRRYDTWFVSRYQDVTSVLSDPEAFSSTGLSFSRALIGMDGDEHMRMRRVVQRGFTLARIRALEKLVREQVREALEGASRRPVFDVVAELADPVPLAVIAALLGMESARIGELRAGAEAVLAGDARGVQRCHDFLAVHLAKVSQPLAGLSADERVAVAMLLVVAGTETTRNFIANAAVVVARDPTLQSRLREREELLEPFLEEVLRFESPVQRLSRTATRETSIAGVRIPAGSSVVALLGAANRDADAFADADRFDASRSPNRHLAFGAGPHYCLGAQLAKLEASVALGELLRAASGLRLAEPALYKMSPSLRAPARVEIQLSR